MSNRKQRRAAAQQHLSQQQRPTDGDSIPLARPSPQPRNAKTLLDIASERNILPASSSSTPHPDPQTVTVTPDGSLTSAPAENEKIRLSATTSTDWPEILLYSTSLSLLHTTLHLLLLSQYSPHPPTFSTLPSLLKSHFLFSPHPYILFILVWLLHPRANATTTQVLFAGMSVLAGAALVKTTNEGGYLAEMKRSPALGTVWVWSVVELRVGWAAGSVLAVVGWAIWMGFGFW